MITWSGNHVTLWVSFPHHKSPPCQVWWSETLQQKGCFVFNLSCEFMWPRDQRIMRHYRWAILIVSHHPAKFGCHRRSAREDISFLVCHMTLRYYMVRALRDVKREFPLSQVTTVQSSMNQRPFGRKDIKLLPRELTWRRSKRVMWHHEWIPFIISHYPAKFCDYKVCRRIYFVFHWSCYLKRGRG